MANESLHHSTDTVALAVAAKRNIESAAATLGEVQKALLIWAEELTFEPENLHQSAVGVQAEAIRTAMSALTVKGASERLQIVSQLALASKGGAQ